MGGNGEQERKLVDTITMPGGVKVAPSKDSMKYFLARSVRQREDSGSCVGMILDARLLTVW